MHQAPLTMNRQTPETSHTRTEPTTPAAPLQRVEIAVDVLRISPEGRKQLLLETTLNATSGELRSDLFVSDQHTAPVMPYLDGSEQENISIKCDARVDAELIHVIGKLVLCHPPVDWDSGEVAQEGTIKKQYSFEVPTLPGVPKLYSFWTSEGGILRLVMTTRAIKALPAHIAA